MAVLAPIKDTNIVGIIIAVRTGGMQCLKSKAVASSAIFTKK